MGLTTDIPRYKEQEKRSKRNWRVGLPILCAVFGFWAGVLYCVAQHKGDTELPKEDVSSTVLKDAFADAKFLYGALLALDEGKEDLARKMIVTAMEVETMRLGPEIVKETDRGLRRTALGLLADIEKYRDETTPPTHSQ